MIVVEAERTFPGQAKKPLFFPNFRRTFSPRTLVPVPPVTGQVKAEEI